MKITSLYAGEGSAVHVSFSEGKEMLIDCGRKRDGERTLCPYFWQQGITSLERVIITSGQPHHYGGLSTLVERIPVAELSIPQAMLMNVQTGKLLASLREKGVQVKAVTEQERFVVKGSTVTIIPCNDALLVTVESCGSCCVFGPSEVIERDGLPPLPPPLLLHLACGRTPFGLERMKAAIQPEYVMLSGTINRKVKGTTEKNVFSTRQHGALSLHITPEGQSLTPFIKGEEEREAMIPTAQAQAFSNHNE